MWLIEVIHKISPKSFAILSWGIMLVVPAWLGSKFFGFYGFWAGIVVGGVLIGYTAQHFLQLVPKKHMLLVMNPLLRVEKTEESSNESSKEGEATIRTILSGWNLLYPWEQAREDGLYSLERIRIPVSEEFPAKDGVPVRVKGSVTVLPDPNNCLNYYLSIKIMREKVMDRVRNYLSQIIAKKEAVAVRNTIKKIDAKATNYFSKGVNNSREEKAGTEVTTELEKRHGIQFENITIDIDYDDSYQKTLTTRARARVMQETVAEIQKGPEENERISTSDAWKHAQVIEGNIRETVSTQRVEAKTAAEALMSFGMAMANAIGGNRSDQGKPDKKRGDK